jgi:hypothetical protein
VNLLLAFAPFIVFVVVERLAGFPAGLAAAALVSAAMLVGDLMMPGRRPKLLEIATFLLFGGLFLLALAMGEQWSIADVRLRVDGGLLLIVLLSMVFQRPFSLQYARASVDRQHGDSPAILRTNYVISAAWVIAFGVLLLADAVMAFMPALSHTGSVAATAVALVAATWFTDWYPEHRRPLKKT